MMGATPIRSHRVHVRVVATLIGLFLLVSLASGCATSGLRFRAIYLDLDGTALDSLHTVRAATTAALVKFQAHGGRVGIATGRTSEQARNAIAAIRPDLPVVLFNGAGIASPMDAEHVRVLRQLDMRTVAVSMEVLQSADSVLGVIAHYANVAIPTKDSRDLQRLAARNSVTLFRGAPPDTSPVKLLAFCTSSRVVRETQSRLQERLGSTARVVQSTDEVIEVLPLGTDKFVAIQEALRGLSIKPEDILAFGDGENDVEMLRGVGFGVAMCGCHPRACDVADIILGSSSSDAISKFIEAFVLPHQGPWGKRIAR